MFSKRKMGLLVGVLAAAISVGSVGAVYAAQDQAATAHMEKAKDGMGMFKGFKHGGGFHNNEDLLALLKLDADKLHEALKAGKSLAQIAKDQGVSTDELVALLKKQQEDRLAEAVKAGKLTQEQADKMKEKADERIKKFIEKTHPRGEGKEHHKGGHGKHFGIGKNEELLALLKLDADEMKAELHAGKSLVEVAQAQGVSKDELVALLIKQREERLAEAVKAGKLTQEQADKRKANMESFIEKFIQHKFDGNRPGS